MTKHIKSYKSKNKFQGFPGPFLQQRASCAITSGVRWTTTVTKAAYWGKIPPAKNEMGNWTELDIWTIWLFLKLLKNIFIILKSQILQKDAMCLFVNKGCSTLGQKGRRWERERGNKSCAYLPFENTWHIQNVFTLYYWCSGTRVLHVLLDTLYKDTPGIKTCQ